MKLILSKIDYLEFKPVYGLELPNYLEQVLGITIDEYYQRGMMQTQRIINAYLQEFLSKIDWDISTLDLELQSQIKNILFCEMDYLHQNQLFFKKANDITYSTSGQQTFTYNPSLDEKDVSLIPDYIVKMIKNTGILKFAESYIQQSQERDLASNEFIDGVFVNDVAWSSKADNVLVYNGQNYTVPQAISALANDKVSTSDTDYQNALEISNSFTSDVNKIIANKLLSSNEAIANKSINDYAQINDLMNLWNGSNALIQNNTKDINTIKEEIINLDNNKLDVDNAQIYLNQKANTNLDNVKLAPRNQIQNVQVNYDGTLTYEQATGNLAPKKWNPERLYDVDGESIWIDDNGTAKIFISTGTENNINQSPLTTTGYWVPYQADFNLDGYMTDEEGANKFLSASGGTLSGNLNLQGNELINASNVLTKDDIDDTKMATNSLWSSEKINNFIEEKAMLLASPLASNVSTQFNFSSSQNFNDGININNPTSTSTVNLKVNEDGKLLANNEPVIQDLTNYYTKEQVNQLIDAVGGELVIDQKSYTLFVKISNPNRQQLTIQPEGRVELLITLEKDFDVDFAYNELISDLKSGYFLTNCNYKNSNPNIIVEDSHWIVQPWSNNNNTVILLFYLTNIGTSSITIDFSARTTNNIVEIVSTKTYAVSKEVAKCYQKYDGTTIDENGINTTQLSINNTPTITSSDNQVAITATNFISTNNNSFSLLGSDELANRKQIENYVASQIANIPSGGQTQIVAGHNIVIENSNIISTMDDVDFDSVSINGNDVETQFNSLNEQVGTFFNVLDETNVKVNANEAKIANIETTTTTNTTSINKLNNEMSQISGYFQNGNIIKFMGVYSPTTQYEAFNYVIDNETDRNTYLSKKASIGIPLSNTDYWIKQDITQTIDLSNYYTKEEIDNQKATISAAIETINTSLDLANNAISKNSADITSNSNNITKNSTAITNQGTQITTLTNSLNSVITRLTTLENDWAINKTTNFLWAELQVYDGNIRVNIYSTLKAKMNVNGTINIRYRAGYSDTGNAEVSTNNVYNITNGTFTTSYPLYTQYSQQYEFFNIGIRVSYNNRLYEGHIPIDQHAYNDYDYNNVSNIIWMPLV